MKHLSGILGLLLFAYVAASAGEDARKGSTAAQDGTPAENPAQKAPGARVAIGDVSEYEGWQIDMPEMRGRVSIAVVKLSVNDLRVVGDRLVGNYELRVPLRSSENESGTVSFEVERPIEQLKSEGGHLEGLGICEQNDRPRFISCRITPNAKRDKHGRVRFTVVGDKHTVKFDSFYRFEPPEPAR